MKNRIAFNLIGLLLGIGCNYEPGTHYGSAQKLKPDPRVEKI